MTAPASEKAATESGDKNVPGFTLIKGVSEAIYLATAACMAEGHIGNAIYDSLNPVPVSNYERPETKLMINMLTGGKAAGSTVRYSRFYLIVDPYANLEVNIPNALNKFIAELKKKFSAIKGGDAAFKLQPEGSYFNAFASATDTFKNMEDAIAASGANGKPQTS